MIIDQNENITTITQENASVIELVKKIEALYPKFKYNKTNSFRTNYRVFKSF